MARGAPDPPPRSSALDIHNYSRIRHAAPMSAVLPAAATTKAWAAQSSADRTDNLRTLTAVIDTSARHAESAGRTYAAEARPLCSRYVAMACPLRLSGAALGGGASVATTATLSESAFCSCGSCSAGSGCLQLPVEDWRESSSWMSNGLIADIAVGHDLH
jgi:hypothetical protein